MNVALRAVHDSLRGGGDPVGRWRSLIAGLSELVGGDGPVESSGLRSLLRSLGCGGTAGEWLSNLRLLGVIRTDGCLDLGRSVAVGVALDVAADSFSTLGHPSSWAPVATLPPELRASLRPPPLRQTAGVLLDLIDRATEEIRLAASFVDARAVEFLAEPLVGAGRRGVDVRVVTSTGHAIHFSDLARKWNLGYEFRGELRVSEVQTDLSPLGSHAKVLVVDSERGYVGSANLTAAGLAGRWSWGSN